MRSFYSYEICTHKFDGTVICKTVVADSLDTVKRLIRSGSVNTYGSTKYRRIYDRLINSYGQWHEFR